MSGSNLQMLVVRFVNQNKRFISAEVQMLKRKHDIINYYFP